MSIHHNCPRCRLKVAEERLKAIPFVCDHCGFTVSKPNSIPEQASEEFDTRLLIGIAGSIVLIFVLLASSVELRWLQTRDFVGLSSISSLNRMIELCTGLRKASCVEYALSRQAKFEPKLSVRHAEYLLGRQKSKEAVLTMKKFISGGKADAAAYIVYARALAEAGQIDEAIKYFERVITSTRTPKMEHMQSYVKYLARAKRFDQALSLIMRARRSHPGAFGVEYRVIAEMRSAGGNRVVAGKNGQPSKGF